MMICKRTEAVDFVEGPGFALAIPVWRRGWHLFLAARRMHSCVRWGWQVRLGLQRILDL
jgi:hypothetical protein